MRGAWSSQRLCAVGAVCAACADFTAAAAPPAACLDGAAHVDAHVDAQDATAADANATAATRPADASKVTDGAVPANDIAAPTVSEFVLAPAGTCAQPADWTTAGYVYDGDTFEVAGGARVRLLGINTPEMTGDSGPECGAKEAKARLIELLPKDAKVCLVKDATKTDKDKYDRLLRYAWVEQAGKTFLVNAWLVRKGMAQVYYPFAKGLLFEQTLLDMQQAAHDDDSGSWKGCFW
ncbi:MAG: thermonuclease family protein [Myxococcales bacterium]|nr:thermonuclease family protein [Myxococcales bacterium]